jgi:hypothetical protein
MAPFVRRFARLASRGLLLVVLGAAFSPTQARSTVAVPSNAGPAVAQNYYYYPEVRLRKLHLVRPDLIPYPIEYEVYC